MAIWRSPGTEPVHLCLLSGHAIVIGPEGRELPPLFEAAAASANCLCVKPKRAAKASVDAPVADPPKEEV